MIIKSGLEKAHGTVGCGDEEEISPRLDLIIRREIINDYQRKGREAKFFFFFLAGFDL